ncbi:MAG: alcohol dehydrogenase catalytic domain-containing protein, partial [Pseudomonadota bacterium]
MLETRAIRMHETGGPEVLTPQSLILPNIGADEVLIRNTVVGLNFLDTYHRSGLYPVPLPFTPGVEGVGLVDSVGAKVRHLKPGDRVAYVGAGAYAQTVKQLGRSVVKLPGDVPDDVAAATFLKGLTAWMLLFEVSEVRPGDRLLVWAAAGGVGSLLVPWAASLGAQVIGVVSTEEKAAKVLSKGADAVVLSDEPVVERVLELT